jgi:MOSC domain-containing protein YiiM
MLGTIIQVSVSPGGLPKLPIAEGYITTQGLKGDRQAHPAIHGGPHKAILLIAAEVVDSLAAQGFPLFYGALGENLTTRGLDFRQLRIGDEIRAGGSHLEITQPRGPCGALDVYGPALREEIYDARVESLDHTSPHWGRSGFYAAVRTEGPVGPGDIIAVLARLA